MRLLLFSNSTNAGEPYLTYPMPHISNFLGKKKQHVLFIPYAAVTFSFDEYEAKVKERFNQIGHELVSIHHFDDFETVLNESDVIVIGGGNTFHLMYFLQKNKLIDYIREKVKNGLPYIGWSAGSNITCPTICTTNDMPIVEPESFEALNLIPFQINPHYTDVVPEGFAGETRDQRITEFLYANKETTVVGLREGTFFHYDNNNIELKGPYSAKIFRYNEMPYQLSSGDDVNFLLK